MNFNKKFYNIYLAVIPNLSRKTPAPKNLTRKKLQIKQIPGNLIKNTYWVIWNKAVKIPEFLDADFIDKYFAEEKKEEVIKKVTKTEEKVIETIKLKTFLDDKRSQMMSILLSRFPYTINDVCKILIEFKIDEVELRKK